MQLLTADIATTVLAYGIMAAGVVAAIVTGFAVALVLTIEAIDDARHPDTQEAPHA
jgi:hypothetical protein